MTTTSLRPRVWLWSVLVGILSAGVSLGRLWLGNRQAITENLWAEDGLFPLCIHKADFLTCLSDPFAGYLLFVPRVLAWPVSAFPWESWALVANLLASALIGVVSALALVFMRRAGMGWLVTIAVALLPSITPMVGLETINAIGSSYKPMLFLATLLVLFVPLGGLSRSWVIFGFVLLLLTALTVPSAVVIAVLVVVQALRRVVLWRVGIVWLIGLAIGLAAQAWVALTAEAARPIDFGVESLNAWADAVPISIFTYWPGLSLGEYSFFANFTLAPVAVTGWLFVVVIAALGVWRLVVGWPSASGSAAPVGLLLLAGLAFGLIPTAIGDPNNRYFVVPLLLWGAAVLVALDPIIRRARVWVLALVTALVLALWWPAIPASAYRSTPAPAWSSEVARIEAKCLSDPAFVDRPLFSPFWPPNWGDGLIEPTHPNLPCTTVFRWLP